MAFNTETRRTDSSNCKMHCFPKSQPGGHVSAPGSVSHQYCNNCLAVKISWSGNVLINGKWEVLTDERIVEPEF